MTAKYRLHFYFLCQQTLVMMHLQQFVFTCKVHVRDFGHVCQHYAIVLVKMGNESGATCTALKTFKNVDF